MREHVARLSHKVSPRVCGTCAKKLKGTSIPRDCSPKCQPHVIARRKSKADRAD